MKLTKKQINEIIANGWYDWRNCSGKKREIEIIKGLKESKKISLKYRHKFFESYTLGDNNEVVSFITHKRPNLNYYHYYCSICNTTKKCWSQPKCFSCFINKTQPTYTFLESSDEE